MILWRLDPPSTRPKGEAWHRHFCWLPVWAQPKPSSDTKPMVLVWLGFVWRQNISGSVHRPPMWRYSYERPYEAT